MKLQDFLVFLCSVVLSACSNNKETATAPFLPPPPDIYWVRETKTGGSQTVVISERGGMRVLNNLTTDFISPSTPAGKYLLTLHRVIAVKWTKELSDPSVASTLIVDRLLVRFHVQPNGALGEIEAVKGKMDSVLGRLTADSLEKASKAIGQFEPQLQKSYPNGFSWEVCFRIY
jgi:hypothetical protein